MTMTTSTVEVDTTIDPFDVDPPAPLWVSVPTFLAMLPLTTAGLAATLALGGAAIPVYRNRSLKTRDRMSKTVMKVLMASARFRIKVIDHNERLEDHSNLYVAPHICMLEAMMMIYAMGHIRPMTAEFTKKLPLFGPFVDASDPIYVKRGEGKGKVSVVDQLRESLEQTEYRHLIFPEGTFTNGRSLLKFKSGAFAVGKPVTPIVFTYPSYKPFWNREESTFLTQLYRISSRVYTPVIMEYLPTYTPSQEELEDAKLYAENVRKYIAAHCDRPLSDKGLKDSPNYKMDRNKKKS